MNTLIDELRRICDSGAAPVRIQFDPDRTSATMAIVDALSRAEETSPLELPPLYEAGIDPTAISQLVPEASSRVRGDGGVNDAVGVAFTVGRKLVWCDPVDGVVEVYDVDEGRESSR